MSRPEGRPRAGSKALLVAAVAARDTPTAADRIPLESNPAGEGHEDETSAERKPFQAGFTLGVGLGHLAFGGKERHDVLLTKVHAGRAIGRIMGEGKWREGQWEVLGELFAGGQHNPDSAYFVGVTPVLRYNFRPRARWRPFFDGGIGIGATDIGEPDLSTIFQFNDQIGVGAHWLFRKSAALTLQYRFMHVSNGSIKEPNHGANISLFHTGLSWFF